MQIDHPDTNRTDQLQHWWKLNNSTIGRSHRSKDAKVKLKFVIDKSKELLNLLSLVLSISFFLMLSVWIYKKKYKLNQFILIISPLLILIYLSLSLDVWVERIHFVEYAVLGLLISRAVNVKTLQGIIYTGCLVTLIGAVDEIIQWFLPNRVGDMRDVFMNSVGGLSGLWLGRFLFWEQQILERNS